MAPLRRQTGLLNGGGHHWLLIGKGSSRVILEALDRNSRRRELLEFAVGVRGRCLHTSRAARRRRCGRGLLRLRQYTARSDEHTSELQSLMRISYAVFCLQKKIL